MSARKPITVGERFYRLTVLSESPAKSRRIMALCKCDCGTEKIVRHEHLRGGLIQSCGCYRLERVTQARRVHGKAGTAIYSIWVHIIGRCENPKDAAFHHYGGRGITVCARWRNSFAAFASDMGPRPKGFSVDRIDNNGNYEPGNCRWATDLEQGRNTRKAKKVTFKGETLALSEWGERIGVAQATLYYRIFTAKWSVDRALTAPTRRHI